MALHEILTDSHTLEQELLDFEARYGVRSETFYAADASGEVLALIAESRRRCAPGQGISTEETRARLAEPGR